MLHRPVDEAYPAAYMLVLNSKVFGSVPGTAQCGAQNIELYSVFLKRGPRVSPKPDRTVQQLVFHARLLSSQAIYLSVSCLLFVFISPPAAVFTFLRPRTEPY